MTVAERVSFSGHETFPFRYTWLKKAVDAVDGDEYPFHADDAMVKLGVGKNMVSSIRHWGVAVGMLQEAPAGVAVESGRSSRRSWADACSAMTDGILSWRTPARSGCSIGSS